LADFKKFTGVDGRTVWVNIDEIALAEPFNDGKQDGYVRITWAAGSGPLGPPSSACDRPSSRSDVVIQDVVFAQRSFAEAFAEPTCVALSTPTIGSGSDLFPLNP